jgi:hypothetical protein
MSDHSDIPSDAARGGETPTGRADSLRAVSAAPAPVAKAADLTASKVVAGGMAAATSAVLGSHFGASGTVGGAAVGSIITTVGTNLYQRSLERARDRVTRQLPLPAVRAPHTATSAPPGPDQARPASGQARLGRLVAVSVLAALLCFGLGLGLITGIEWVKGSPLSGGNAGTSLEHAFTPSPPSAPPSIAPLSPPPSTEPESSVTQTPLPSPEPNSDLLHPDTSTKDKPKSKDSLSPQVSIVPSSPLPLPLPEIGLPGG